MAIASSTSVIGSSLPPIAFYEPDAKFVSAQSPDDAAKYARQ
jgi:hypothetical protein